MTRQVENQNLKLNILALNCDKINSGFEIIRSVCDREKYGLKY